MAFEQEKSWLDAKLAGGDIEKGLDATTYNIDEEDADDGKDDGSGIECQCCFADYPFVRASIVLVLCYSDLFLSLPSPTWFNAPTPTSFAQPASQPTLPPN